MKKTRTPKAHRRRQNRPSKFFVQDSWKQQLYVLILRHPDLSAYDKCVGLFILLHFKTTARCYMSRETIAEGCAISVRQVSRSIEALKDAKLLIVHREIRGRRKDGTPVYGTTNHANVYEFPIQHIQVEYAKSLIDGLPEDDEEDDSEGPTVPQTEDPEGPTVPQKQNILRDNWCNSEGPTVPPSNYVTAALPPRKSLRDRHPATRGVFSALSCRQKEQYDQNIEPGDRVTHKDFGTGTVQTKSEEFPGIGAIATVLFDGREEPARIYATSLKPVVAAGDFGTEIPEPAQLPPHVTLGATVIHKRQSATVKNLRGDNGRVLVEYAEPSTNGRQAMAWVDPAKLKPAPDPSPAPTASQPPEPRVAEKPALAIGERVFHQKFGNGITTAMDGGNLTILFDKAGEQRVAHGSVELV